MTIRSLKSNVTREEAIQCFAPAGPTGVIRSLARGPLTSLADLYIPFRVFQITVRNNGVRQSKLVAMDTISGLLDLYGFDSVPAEVVSIETRNRPESRLSDSECKRLVIDKFRRLVFNQGFFRLRDFQLEALCTDEELHIPYWIGFRGKGPYLRISVLDAVRRRMEGAKVRQLVESWLMDRNASHAAARGDALEVSAV
jgi:hypothetical protein